MKKLLTPSRTLAAQILLGFWGCASAQSLGSPSAETLLGRPLEMSVPARFDPADKGDECVHADVFFGENRLRSDRVRTSVTGTDQHRRIRIETDVPIDEPVVTVSVRAGCRNTITRNYTLLPEYPSDRLLAAAEARQAMAQAVPVTPLRLATSTATAPRSVVRREATERAPAELRETAAAVASSARAPFRKEAGAVRGPRLRLEPIDGTDTTALRVSPRLSEPSGDPAQRATAALLWKAINADPQELMQATAMLQKLEGELAQLRLSSAQTRAEMAALRKRLDEAQPWYASAAMVQGLLLLLLAGGAAAGVLWWRSRGVTGGLSPWYQPEPEEQARAAAEPVLADQVDVVTEVAPQPAAPARRAPLFQPRPLAVPDVAVPATAIASRPAAAPQAAPVDFEVPPAALPRRASDGVLRVETLAATFEEVEFLSSLGLGSDAMDVLKAYLQDSGSPAPLAFFELMRLCDAAGDAPAVATVRRRYTHAFGVDAPRLEQLTAPLGLEGVTDLSQRISAAWGTADALDLIEQALFKVPAPGTALTLQAGRDLLCLYDLAMALLTEAASTPGSANDASVHPLAPWAHAEDAHSAHALAESAAEARGGHQFGIDIDLSASMPEPLPESTADSRNAPLEFELEPLMAASFQAQREQEAARAKAATDQDHEDAFSAVMASERLPVSRF